MELAYNVYFQSKKFEDRVAACSSFLLAIEQQSDEPLKWLDFESSLLDCESDKEFTAQLLRLSRKDDIPSHIKQELCSCLDDQVCVVSLFISFLMMQQKKLDVSFDSVAIMSAYKWACKDGWLQL